MRPARVLAMLVLAFVGSPLAPLHSSSARAPVVQMQTVSAASATVSPPLTLDPPTTTAPPSTTSTTIVHVKHTTTTSTGEHPCGGDLPPCWVMMRESRGDPNAYNPRGCSGRGCYGKWQCDPRTCSGTGTEAQQDDEARALWDGGRGCAHWNAC